LTNDLAEFSARAEALESDVATARRERDSLRAELAACRAERDRLRLRDADRALLVARLESMSVESDTHLQRALAGERTAQERAGELAAIRETLSWRITRPLRALRRRTIRA
jgi:hypothetical protein